MFTILDKNNQVLIGDENREKLINTLKFMPQYNQNMIEECEVETAYTGKQYKKGFAPLEPQKTYAQKRALEYPPIAEQLDMIYWDKINNTSLWQEKIAQIKAKYPKA